MDKDNLPKTHVEQLDDLKPLRAANENPSIQEEKVLGPMDDASTTTKTDEGLTKQEKKSNIQKENETSRGGRGGKSTPPQNNAGKTWIQRLFGREPGGSSGVGGGSVPSNHQFEPKDFDDKLDQDDDPLSSNQVEEKDGQQELATLSFDDDKKGDSNFVPQNPAENDKPELDFANFSNQPSIENVALNSDEISKEDFKAALQDVVFTSTDKNDISDLSNITREDFSNALADLNSNGNDFGNDFGNLAKETEDNKEDILMAMNDFDGSSDKDEIGSFYWESEVFEEKLEMGEIDEDGSPSMDMGGGDDD